jgi:aspartate racemase
MVLPHDPLVPQLRGTTGLVGVLGGMGPLATVDFMQKVLQANPSLHDQDHVPLIVSSIPQIPDRTAAFRGEGNSPFPAMLESGRRLVQAGAELIVMPCNTAHLWFDPLREAVALPMLHLVDAALADALAATQGQDGPAVVGLLATDATLASGLYVNRAARRTEGEPIQWALPTARETLEAVMPGIEAVKAGDLATGERLLQRAAAALVQRGAKVLILGCTEIPLVIRPDNSPLPVVDATASLARQVVAWSNAQRRRDGATATH